MSDAPSPGALPDSRGTRFRVVAPRAQRLEVQIESGVAAGRVPMQPDGSGRHEAFVAGARAGDRYRIVLDGQPFPDPATRYQPGGVHGASAIVNPSAFAWTDSGWKGIPLERAVIYEIHVGTFTPEGTFAALTERLPALADLGVTIIELMPVADFPGRWNWGYDGAALFAPARCYGTPEDLRRLVDRAHALGLGVHLDVVYNHLGPDGAYAAPFNPDFFSERHRSPWGAGINLDGPNSRLTRDYFIENAIHWVREYHMDGLRLDATHAMVDDSARHFLAELGERVRDAAPGRHVLVVAEDGRNWAHMVKPEAEGGWGLDAAWADDFHHCARRLLAGDADGYFRPLRGSVSELAAIVRAGWRFGPAHRYGEGDTRTDPTGLAPGRFVICTQNHDQVGNRAFGERLHHQIDPAAWRAISALLLLAPQTPLLFMGQEWAAGAPFHFFTDHAEPLGSAVTAGRKAEFTHFDAFNDPAILARIPDPQDPATFERSRLDWSERERGHHAKTLALYRALLALRREHPALRAAVAGAHDARALNDDVVLLSRKGEGGGALHLLVRLRGLGAIERPAELAGRAVLLHTESGAWCDDPRPPGVTNDAITFARPGAILFS